MTPEDMFMELIRDIANELNVNQLCHKILVNVCVLVRLHVFDLPLGSSLGYDTLFVCLSSVCNACIVAKRCVVRGLQ